MRRPIRLSAERLEDRCLPAVDLLGAAGALTGGPEHAAQVVTASYQQLLGRAPAPGETAYWAGQLEAGLRPEQLGGDLAASAEFINAHGGPGAAWVAALYADLLGRAPEPGAVPFWQTQTALTGTNQVAAEIATSPEREGQVVQGAYQRFFNAPADPLTVGSWVNQLVAGLDSRTLEARLLASPGYRGQFPDDATWLNATYAAVLGRAPSPAEAAAWLSSPAPAPAPGGANFTDVVQQASPTCSFAASLAAASHAGYNLPARVTYLGGTAYNVALYNPQVNAFNALAGFGPVLNVRVTYDGATNPATDLAVPADGSVWPLLFQRAYDQTFGGSPFAHDSAFTMMVLTGQANVALPGSDWAFGAKTPAPGDEALMAQALAQGQPVVADTRGSGGLVIDPTTGLIGSHSYMVLGAGGGFVTLYNPWGVDTDWHLLDTNNDGQLSAAEAARSPDGLGGNFNDGLLRVSVSTFQTYFNDWVAG